MQSPLVSSNLSVLPLGKMPSEGKRNLLQPAQQDGGGGVFPPRHVSGRQGCYGDRGKAEGCKTAQRHTRMPPEAKSSGQAGRAVPDSSVCETARPYDRTRGATTSLELIGPWSHHPPQLYLGMKPDLVLSAPSKLLLPFPLFFTSLLSRELEIGLDPHFSSILRAHPFVEWTPTQ